MPCEDSKKKIINRLKTIKGHIAGVERMVDEGKACDEILLQLTAIKSSVHKVGLVIMEENANDCLNPLEGDEKERMSEIINTLINFSK